MLGFDTAYNSSEAIVFYGSYKSPYFLEVNVIIIVLRLSYYQL